MQVILTYVKHIITLEVGLLYSVHLTTLIITFSFGSIEADCVINENVL